MPARPEPIPVAIVTAMREELRAIPRANVSGSGRGPFRELQIAGTEVVLMMTGDGPGRAERGVAALLEAFRPAALLGIGIGGALTPDLRAGSLVVSRRIRDETGEVPSPDPQLLARAIRFGALGGSLVSVRRPAVSRAEKAALAASAGGGPAAVDTESAIWARAASARGIPYVVVRAISDAADEDLPEYLSRCLREDGSMRRGAVVAHALARPATVPALWRLRRRVAAGSARLSEFLEKMLRREA
jgi:adenosylhomocysteine nucleosidase